ncbi:dihydroorotate dehydrogenase [Salmonella enterica subsp. enterica]|uniref:Dihydroorotate dehydrogenase n=1 Tax=Salmonella enterica I TaxID=59201 RepID=A0A3S4F651_SALET|nr:dihydroorotate dehydrogenase [Salmonella enterica subsp. enterica]
MNLHFNNYAALQVRRWKRWCARKYRQSRLPAWDLPLKIHWGWLPVWIKTGECIDALGAMGFGSLEIGTVTPRPQPGNDKPRLFRLVDAEGLINRMGFNNLGVDNLVENVKKAHFDGILGINIGKNKDTPVENGKDDYLICMEKVYAYAGYIAINISSPNTPGATYAPVWRCAGRSVNCH